MPIFEYVCRNCQHQFELIVNGSAVPKCPSCGSKKLEKQLSVFTAASKSYAKSELPAAAACGTCGDPRGPGSCSMN